MKETDKVRCPTCGSTQIVAGTKDAYSIPVPIGATEGLLTSGRVTVTCLKCGNEWRPGHDKPTRLTWWYFVGLALLVVAILIPGIIGQCQLNRQWEEREQKDREWNRLQEEKRRNELRPKFQTTPEEAENERLREEQLEQEMADKYRRELEAKRSRD